MNGFETRILNYINRPDYEPSTKKDLARALHIKKVDRREFQASVTRLLHSEKLVKMRSGLLAPTQLTRRATNKGPAGLVAGIVKRTSRGAAYVIPHERLASSRLSDIFVSETDVRDAQTGDEVLVRLLKRRGSGGRRIGRIEEVLERAATSFVGTYLEKGGQGHVQMAGPAFRETVRVDDPSAKGARPGDKVVVEMLRFPTPFQRGEGVITKVLGPRGQPGIDTLCIIHEFGLRHEFPPQVLDEARERAAGFDEQDIDDRLDLTNELTITIDPADARDFDDAVSLSRTKLGGWHLGVHIADVSHFVRTDTPLDFEARLRGTSVYLPNRVLPMLPEVISNGVASLQQGRVRYTRSVFIEFSPDILPVHMEFAKSAIKVTRRFAYEDVMSIIRDPDRFRGRISAKVRALILQMHELSKLLRSQRLKNGALSLDMPEIEIDFDKQGEVVGAHRVAQDESHQLIEEFMLAANTAVARSLRERGIGFLRRIHEGPDVLKLKAFAQFVTLLGIPLKQYQSRSALQAVLDRVKGKPTETAVNYALLRAMKQAVYSPDDMGHYALAVEDYCHFTSPIRRYPDLTVHRLMDDLTGTHRRRTPHELELKKLGTHCSVAERRAEQAERELKKIKLLALLAKRIGSEFDAIITGVERFGIFCQPVEIPAEGLIHITTLDDDFYDFDAAARALIGRRRGRTYRLGGTVRVQVAHVDVDCRELDFRLVTRQSRRRKPSR